MGATRLSELDAIFDLGAKTCIDPEISLFLQHFKALVAVARAWPEEQKDLLASTWDHAWARARAAPHPWRLARGPVSAMCAYLMQHDIQALSMVKWRLKACTIKLSLRRLIEQKNS
jgi:hypothetical protein